MNLTDEKYSNVNLVKDMLATTGIVEKFDCNQMTGAAAAVKETGKLLMTGEGSSRIFPAKHAIKVAMQRGYDLQLMTEAGKQSQEYRLDDWAVFALSNSGRTAEVIQLFQQLKESGHEHLYSLTAYENTKLEALATRGYVLTCGKEGAVAATKSVIEQGLFYQALLEHVAGQPARNDGVAEELTLKTNEITRKPSDYFEGTYGVHGVEEVLDATDVVIWINPYPDQEEKFKEVLVKGVGLTVIAVASRDTIFPTIRIPDAGDLSGYIEMAAGWNILVEAGTVLGINLDKPERARKVGNEFVG